MVLGLDDNLNLGVEIAEGRLELLCPRMRLLRCPNYLDVMFEGAGVIKADSDGRLWYEVIGSYPASVPRLCDLPRPQHGERPEDSAHVILAAEDGYGREWRGTWMTPRAFPMSTRARYWIVRGRVEELIAFSERPKASLSECRMVLRSPGILPLDQPTRTVEFVDDEKRSVSVARDRHASELVGARVEFQEVDQKWLQISARKEGILGPEWPGFVCQALSVATAKTSRPLVISRSFAEGEQLGIFSVAEPPASCFLTPPVTPHSGDDYWSFVEMFAEWAASAKAPVRERVFQELAGIRSGSQGSIQTASLTLSVGIEALAGILDSTQSEKRTGRLKELITHVKAWEGDEKLRERACGMLGALAHPRAVDRLHGLAENQGIDPELVTSWKRLRNRSAHGGAGSSEQEMLDAYYSSTELLYRVIAATIGYRGVILPTASRGWGLNE